ncbi:extracellular solute-binding protein [Iocasia frigidifontis]|uniref:Extracellular solute-binding protein n=1 Tax=Iocasia fonsfrigidae TaxID=2682810 RepID=A0A8A7KEU9_9FIRM|nr:ABC transporter substrate-binding protein [Iocasia fonsfrigidae]QTL97427.1 extracellular solute-binding protein [Iocasia fonsfrigidae]
MKKFFSLLLVCSILLSSFVIVFSNVNTVASASSNKYPEGTIEIYGYGQPQYFLKYYRPWLERNRDIAPKVSIDIVQTEGAADVREKLTMSYVAGAYDDLPDAFYIDPVNLVNLADGGLVQDVTDFVSSLTDKLVDNAANDATINGSIYALPESVRPQMLYYNQKIFNEYNIDPERMNTIEGYIEVGRELKEKSNGKVYLSYIDPGSRTWRYYGRRGLMPQAKAKIWDDNGYPIIDTDPGARLAFEALDTMYSEGLLLKTAIFQPALYDAVNNGEIATFYIGAFWDEFLRKNCTETLGDWRVMPAPVFKSINLRGAPVSQYIAIVDKPNAVYSGLIKKMWYDFTFDIEHKEKWVRSMVRLDAPYANPISVEMLKDEFWEEPSIFYGGQSFRKMEKIALRNGAPNLVVTAQDAEADIIISNELEKYVAGVQTIDEAIKAMGENLRNKIGKVEVIK